MNPKEAKQDGARPGTQREKGPRTYENAIASSEPATAHQLEASRELTETFGEEQQVSVSTQK